MTEEDKHMPLPNELCVTVDDDDIREGVPEDAHSCPLARAIKRTTGTDGVWVGYDSIRVNGVLYQQSDAGERFVDMFDNFSRYHQEGECYEEEEDCGFMHFRPDNYGEVVHPREFCFNRERPLSAAEVEAFERNT